MGWHYNDYESISVGGAAVGLTAAKVAGHRSVLITVEGATVRFRLDGVDPTTSEGHLLNAGDVLPPGVLGRSCQRAVH
jgi:hypothetical protein